jgi:hypothetical protein
VPDSDNSVYLGINQSESLKERYCGVRQGRFWGMKRTRWKFMIACAWLVLMAASAIAKRVNPKPVSPVIFKGIRYSAEGDGRDQYVVAADDTNGKLLWKVRIFHNNIKFWIEEDVQWVFITDLKLLDNSILVRDEMSRCYSIDLATRHVKNRSCVSIFSQ